MREFPLFKLLEFCYFWNSPNGEAMPFARARPPALLAPLSMVPYMLAGEVYNSGGRRYFIREDDKVVGILVLKVRHDAMFVSTLATSPTKRGRGVGTFVLGQAEGAAKSMNLPWLELEVLKHNVHARRLYSRSGFKICARRRWSLALRKPV